MTFFTYQYEKDGQEQDDKEEKSELPKQNKQNQNRRAEFEEQTGPPTICNLSAKKFKITLPANQCSKDIS